MSEDLNRLLVSPTKEQNEARGVLARLWRCVLMDIGMTPSVWHRLMTSYLNNPENGIAQNDGKRKSSTRGNMNKALGKQTMSWKTFITGIRFLSPVSAEFEIRLKWRNRPNPTVHTLTMDLSNKDVIDDEPD